jgi:tight adherence protein B
MPEAVLVAVLGATSIGLLTIAMWLPAYSRQRSMRRRLATSLSGEQQITFDLAGGRRRRGMPRQSSDAIRALPGIGAIERRIQQAAVDLTPAEVIAVMLALTVVGGAVGWLLSGTVASIAGAAAGAYAPLFWLSRRERSRQRRFVEQLPDSISLLSSTVRGGHSLLQGIEQVAKESEEPTRSAFELTVREIGLGSSQEEAIDRLRQRFPSDDMSLMAASINVHYQIGGSLSRILDDMAATLRERVRIEGDVRALTAQQRYSAYVLALLPVAVTAALFLISPDYIGRLFEGTLRLAAAAAALLITVGFLIMRKIASIDV